MSEFRDGFIEGFKFAARARYDYGIKCELYNGYSTDEIVLAIGEYLPKDEEEKEAEPAPPAVDDDLKRKRQENMAKARAAKKKKQGG